MAQVTVIEGIRMPYKSHLTLDAEKCVAKEAIKVVSLD